MSTGSVHGFILTKGLGPDVFHVEDRQVPVSQPAGEITVRIYSPEGPGPLPVHLNFHGGKSFHCPQYFHVGI